MADATDDAGPGDVLILAPTGRDGAGAASLFRRQGIGCTVCNGAAELVGAMDETAGAVVVADEALVRGVPKDLAERLRGQPPWSDLPFLVLTHGGAGARRAVAELRLPEVLGNVVFLERPLNAMTLVSAVRSALRARRRQREIGAHLAQRDASAAALATSEARLRDLNEKLEARVEARTAELQEAEEQLRQAQKMEAVGQLTGGIAHDFNNMLQGITSCLELVRRRVAKGRMDEVEQYMDAAVRTAARAGALTNRLLAFARRQALEPRPVDPDALIAGMVDLIRRTVGPSVQVDLVPKDGPWSVLCDPNQLESALLNLAINARDAMPQGGRLLVATADVVLPDPHSAGDPTAGEHVEIAVSDTGVGMDAATLGRAFEPFFTTKPLGQGTGLGLSQLYGFVRQSGGVVRLESVPGRGTTVRLLLPRHVAVADEAVAVAAPAEPGRGGGETVLLVEDEEVVRGPAADRLRELGYAVLERSDGPGALAVLHSEATIHLLVTDVGLPHGPNGRQVADAALVRRPGLPVLFITGYAGPALQAQLPEGMAVIGKPFTLDALVAKVQAVLGGAVAQTASASHGEFGGLAGADPP